MLFLVARDIEVAPVDSPGDERTIAAGETVRMVPEFAAAPVANLVWKGTRFTCDRITFLSSASPIGPAGD